VFDGEASDHRGGDQRRVAERDHDPAGGVPGVPGVQGVPGVPGAQGLQAAAQRGGLAGAPLRAEHRQRPPEVDGRADLRRVGAEDDDDRIQRLHGHRALRVDGPLQQRTALKRRQLLGGMAEAGARAGRQDQAGGHRRHRYAVSPRRMAEIEAF
jgi:hypothetical protein